MEVTERFADGQADQQAVENAANAVARVRKGDRRANRAAQLQSEEPYRAMVLQAEQISGAGTTEQNRADTSLEKSYAP